MTEVLASPVDASDAAGRSVSCSFEDAAADLRVVPSEGEPAAALPGLPQPRLPRACSGRRAVVRRDRRLVFPYAATSPPLQAARAHNPRSAAPMVERHGHLLAEPSLPDPGRGFAMHAEYGGGQLGTRRVTEMTWIWSS